MANYRKTFVDAALDGALDTAGHQQQASDALELVPTLDTRMDSHQERGYALVRRILRESTDPDARSLARAALLAFGRAEEAEALIEGHVVEGAASVGEAQTSLRGAIEVLEGHRREPALVEVA